MELADSRANKQKGIKKLKRERTIGKESKQKGTKEEGAAERDKSQEKQVLNQELKHYR